MKGPLFLSARHRTARDRVAAALAAIDGDHRAADFKPEAVYRELGDAIDQLQQLESEDT